MDTTWIPFNINECVRVKLTPYGRRRLELNHTRFPWPYSPPKEDEDGWSRWQLWHLMEEFGPHVHMTAPNCFALDIEFELDLDRAIRRLAAR